jgi:NapC/NirT cytochrome c family, N-terminal region/Planctomycete cytochrome C
MHVSAQDLGRDEDRGPEDSSIRETGDPQISEASAKQAESAAPEEYALEARSGETVKPRRKKRVRTALHNFFLPPEGSRLWRRALPWASLVVVVVGVVVGAAHGWAWTNSPGFCGEFCHTMPPQYASYKLSPHSRVTCVECHIGREFIGKQLPRKAVHTQFVFRMAVGAYEYPLYVKGMRPARDACETCHAPAKFSDDSVRVNQHYRTDEPNTPYNITLIMKTGGGTKREGLGRGIHWHIENKVQFLSTDKLDQDVPYIRVTNEDGTVDEYVDVESGFDSSTVDPSSLKTMDCITCHNRISHTVAPPVDAVESAMARGAISSDIPYIRDLGVQALTKIYADQEQAFSLIAQALNDYYQESQPDFYATGQDKLQAAIAELQRIYSVSVFKEQEIDWNTHPDNVGHISSPGCFRCHDGKHLNTEKQAIRLECNICHSIPVVSTGDKLVTDVEINRGPEPDSHRNSNWISLHNRAYLTDKTCANCHTVADAGGTSDTSFCSNSACHGTDYPFAGFDAPALRDILREQVPARPTTPVPSTTGKPTYNSFFGPLFTKKCGACHGSNGSAGLNLTSYVDAMKGSSSGPVIIPGDSTMSRIVQVQEAEHFANFSSQEFEAVIDWIDSGAPEK